MEITRESHLTRRGDCVVAVGADCGLLDFPIEMKKALSNDNGQGSLTLRVGSEHFTVSGRGSEGLTFSHQSEIVLRRGSFTSDRTLLVHCDKAAVDIPRRMVSLLQDPDRLILIEVSTTP